MAENMEKRVPKGNIRFSISYQKNRKMLNLKY